MARQPVLDTAGSWSKLAAYAAAIGSVALGVAAGAVLNLVSGDLLLR